MATKHVIPEIEFIFKRFGFPKLLRSDNVAAFNGQEWDKFNEKFKITKDLEHNIIINQSGKIYAEYLNTASFC